MFATRFWRAMVGEPGGTRGLDDAFARLHDPGIGAEIMGAGKFGYPGWHEDTEWKGWWGADPPFHTPVFVLTHQPRPSIEMEGGTTFHFLDVSPAEALETAREAADGQDVRVGGGATDPARPRRAPVGGAGGPREGLSGRGRPLAQRSDPCDIHAGGVSRSGAHSLVRPTP
jgi:hypothetical protein